MTICGRMTQHKSVQFFHRERERITQETARKAQDLFRDKTRNQSKWKKGKENQRREIEVGFNG